MLVFYYPSQDLQEHSQILLHFILVAVEVTSRVNLFSITPPSLDSTPNFPNLDLVNQITPNQSVLPQPKSLSCSL